MTHVSLYPEEEYGFMAHLWQALDKQLGMERWETLAETDQAEVRVFLCWPGEDGAGRAQGKALAMAR